MPGRKRTTDIDTWQWTAPAINPFPFLSPCHTTLASAPRQAAGVSIQHCVIMCPHGRETAHFSSMQVFFFFFYEGAASGEVRTGMPMRRAPTRGGGCAHVIDVITPVSEQPLQLNSFLGRGTRQIKGGQIRLSQLHEYGPDGKMLFYNS